MDDRYMCCEEYCSGKPAGSSFNTTVVKSILKYINDDISGASKCVGPMPWESFIVCRNLIAGEMRNNGISGSIGGVPKLSVIAETLKEYCDYPFISYVTFKSSAEYTDVFLMSESGELVKQISHTVLVIGRFIVDFIGGYCGITMREYMCILYKSNDVLRIDTNLSDITFAENLELFDQYVYGFLTLREGMPRNKYYEHISAM